MLVNKSTENESSNSVAIPNENPNSVTIQYNKEPSVRESNLIRLKKDDRIQLFNTDTESWEEATILSRAVKLSSQRLDKNWFNVQTGA